MGVGSRDGRALGSCILAISTGATRSIAKWRNLFQIGLSVPPSAPVEMTRYLGRRWGNLFDLALGRSHPTGARSEQSDWQNLLASGGAAVVSYTSGLL